MDEINLKEFLGYLKRYIVAYILVLAAALAGTYFYETELKTPLYQARTTVVIAQADSNTNAAATLNDVNASQKLASTYGEIAKSELVLQQVINDLNLNTTVQELTKKIKVSAIEDTTILSISVNDPDAGQAARIANKIAEIFTTEVENRYKLDNVSVLDVAKTPEKVANNTLTRDMVIAAMLSIFGVTALAFLLFYLDDTVKYSEDLEQKVNLPIAGRVVKSEIKLIDKKPKEKKTQIMVPGATISAPQTREISQEVVVEKYPKSIVSENIKSLRTNLQFTSVDKDLKTILVTSTNAGEGKSFIAANLATSFAQADKRVLIVDCDLRKGRLHQIFDVPNVQGFSNLITDEINNNGRYIQSTGIKNLSIITRGTYPPNPSELLASRKNRTLIAQLRNMFDIIIFDGAPCNGLADSVILSNLVDEVLIVTRDSATTKSDLNATKSALEKANANIAGIVLNAVNKKITKYYSYYGEDK